MSLYKQPHMTPCLIYVTGPNGAGKSTLCTLLKEQGYTAYSIDQGISRHYNNLTGKPVKYPWNPKVRGADWHYRHTYKIPQERMAQFAAEARNGTVFLCGIAANFLDLQAFFDAAFYLAIDLPTMRLRLSQRSNNEFGKAPDELQFAVETHQRLVQECTLAHFTQINAQRAPLIVLEDVLAHLNTAKQARQPLTC